MHRNNDNSMYEIFEQIFFSKAESIIKLETKAAA